MTSSPLGAPSVAGINTSLSTGSVLPCGLVLYGAGSTTAGLLCRGGGSAGAVDARVAAVPGPGPLGSLLGPGFDAVSALQLARLSRYQASAAAAAAAIINGGTTASTSSGPVPLHQSSSMTGHHLLSYYLYARHQQQQQQRLQHERSYQHSAGNSQTTSENIHLYSPRKIT